MGVCNKRDNLRAYLNSMRFLDGWILAAYCAVPKDIVHCLQGSTFAYSDRYAMQENFT